MVTSLIEDDVKEIIRSKKFCNAAHQTFQAAGKKIQLAAKYRFQFLGIIAAGIRGTMAGLKF